MFEKRINGVINDVIRYTGEATTKFEWGVNEHLQSGGYYFASRTIAYVSVLLDDICSWIDEPLEAISVDILESYKREVADCLMCPVTDISSDISIMFDELKLNAIENIVYESRKDAVKTFDDANLESARRFIVNRFREKIDEKTIEILRKLSSLADVLDHKLAYTRNHFDK